MEGCVGRFSVAANDDGDMDGDVEDNDGLAPGLDDVWDRTRFVASGAHAPMIIGGIKPPSPRAAGKRRPRAAGVDQRQPTATSKLQGGEATSQGAGALFFCPKIILDRNAPSGLHM